MEFSFCNTECSQKWEKADGLRILGELAEECKVMARKYDMHQNMAGMFRSGMSVAYADCIRRIEDLILRYR